MKDSVCKALTSWVPKTDGSFQTSTNDICHGDSMSSCSPQPAFRKHPSKLFVETTTRCNFQCQACVKQSDGNGIVDGDMSIPTFLSLRPAFPHLESLVLNGIGEPLLNPHLEDFIRIAKDQMPRSAWVGFQSNGALLLKERAAALVDAGVDRICFSLDSVSCESFQKFREGGELGDVERALAVIAAAKAQAGKPGLETGIEFVLRRDNFHELPQVLEWAAQRGATFAIVSHLLPYHQTLLSQIAYEYNSDQALELYGTWKSRAQAEGIALEEFHKVYFKFKFRYTDEELRLLFCAGKMLLDANKRGVFLQVKNLLAKEDLLRREMGRTFEAAQEVARRKGLALKLPEVVPKSDRRCDFVEGGAAMISWDGSVHPCYHLWHTYSCYTKGRDTARKIDAKNFGHLENRNIGEIWNDADFRKFREEVVGYEFSWCSNCNVAPCDALTNEKFINDCYLSSVPCGDCFWCMGMFNCLQ
jgi:putative metalloenzyme radical SAM/SPASM domain maturase